MFSSLNCIIGVFTLVLKVTTQCCSPKHKCGMLRGGQGEKTNGALKSF